MNEETRASILPRLILMHCQECFRALQRIATRCNTLQHTTTRFNTLQLTATRQTPSHTPCSLACTRTPYSHALSGVLQDKGAKESKKIEAKSRDQIFTLEKVSVLQCVL